MLTLTRKDREQILIGDSITVTVVRARNGKVKIGVDAPNHVLVLRSELADAEEVEV